MASPKFSPTAFSPASDTIPPVTSSSSNSSAASPSPTHNTNQTSNPPTSSPSATPPQSSPPSIAALPPSPSQSLSPQSPPPSAPTLRPPPPSSLPPPPSSPPTLFRPPPPSSPSPPTPPPLPPSVPPTVNSPPPPETSLSPPTGSIPPKSSPVPPAATSPPPPPPRLTHPPQSNSTPTTQAPGNPISPSSPPSIPSSSSSTPVSSPTPPGNLPASGTPTASPLPVLPTEKPTANPTPTDANDKAVTTSSKTGGTEGVNTGAAVGIGTVIGFIALGLIIMAVLFVQKRKKRALRLNVGNAMNSPFASQNSDTSFLKPHNSVIRFRSSSGSDFIYSPSEPGEVGNSRSWFSYEELAEATDSFSVHNLLGKGGFGCVYKGCLEDGREVAVKQLNIDGGQGEREFRAEVETISRVHHRHLVSLVGYCISEHERLLVYEYVPNNTLHHHLHGEDRSILNWATRAKIAAGAARGIAYLHEDCHPRIIHRDIKSSNILLDENFEARVSDFGLAKLALDAYTHITTRVMGTFGYLAPEYASSGKLTEKSDVYSFGVVLLELITGREPVDATQPVGEESLVEWARPLLTQALDTENFEDLVDPRLEKNYVASEMFRMVEAAAACVRHSAVKRPRMGQVVRALGSVDEFPDLTNGMKLGQSAIYDSREQSARIRMFQRMAFGSQEFSSDLYNDQSKSSWRS